MGVEDGAETFCHNPSPNFAYPKYPKFGLNANRANINNCTVVPSGVDVRDVTSDKDVVHTRQFSLVE